MVEPVDPREEDADEKQREMHPPTLVEVRKTPKQHEADEDVLRSFLPYEMDREQVPGLDRKEAFGDQESGGAREHAKSAEPRIHDAGENLHRFFTAFRFGFSFRVAACPAGG